LRITGEVFLQDIGKEKQFHNHKEKYKLYTDDQPETFPELHVFKAFCVK
jgi:hypothetical protein